MTRMHGYTWSLNTAGALLQEMLVALGFEQDDARAQTRVVALGSAHSAGRTGICSQRSERSKYEPKQLVGMHSLGSP